MNRYLLLILLSSWAHVVPLSWQCETGVAYPDHVLSIQRSLMANADLAHLKTYTAEDVNQCLKQCCTEKYGSCTVASFKKNATEDNCRHFNCRPVQKCKFVSSKLTDSFSFTSSSSPQILVPSSHASKNDTLSTTTTTVTTDKPKLHTIAQNEQQAVTKEAVATYSEEQLAFKNDNTSVKPRKGVTEDVTDSPFENSSRSGVKPRKGVVLDGIILSNSTKSKVKPRKGVGPYESQPISSSTVQPSTYETISSQKNAHRTSSATNVYKDIIADDLVSALEKVFEDDTGVKDTKPSISSSTVHHVSNIESTTIKSIESSTVNHHSSIMPTSLTTQHIVVSVTEMSSSSILQSSLSTSPTASSSVKTPNLQTTFIEATETVNHTPLPSSSPTIFEHSKLLFHEVSDSGGLKTEESTTLEESESERKYRSSMRLVLSLVFGLLVLFSVLGVVAKRVYDSWMRRHYRRMDFLIDGMYNGFG